MSGCERVAAGPRCIYPRLGDGHRQCELNGRHRSMIRQLMLRVDARRAFELRRTAETSGDVAPRQGMLTLDDYESQKKPHRTGLQRNKFSGLHMISGGFHVAYHVPSRVSSHVRGTLRNKLLTRRAHISC
ncbi:hypothetical protein HYPSUDRAFT_1010638 [Hypholoma sublateritium FD-334 SS-4]|uniref:Uncharacterized protein n=1 Tax=Hypholoma sublateritium (strain FD-334 SS-4) TaxID=945553 RepID=A0A0D2M353_HYPSF|nr:hypothetical protein HYPSUDRAFT_1010638 [Hypholoma sublateritium FD-334 SS-4]